MIKICKLNSLASNLKPPGVVQWQHFGKHVSRIARTGLAKPQAEEIVEVQQEVATDVFDNKAEKFVTREHFDAEVKNLKEHMDLGMANLKESIESAVADCKESIESAVAGSLKSEVAGLKKRNDSWGDSLCSDLRDIGTHFRTEMRILQAEIRALTRITAIAFGVIIILQTVILVGILSLLD